MSAPSHGCFNVSVAAHLRSLKAKPLTPLVPLYIHIVLFYLTDKPHGNLLFSTIFSCPSCAFLFRCASPRNANNELQNVEVGWKAGRRKYFVK